MTGVFQDSGVVNLKAVTGTVGGAPAEIGVVRIMEEAGPWILRAKMVWPAPPVGKGTFSPPGGIPSCYLKITEGRNRAQTTWETDHQAPIARDFAYQSSGHTLDVSCVVLRPGFNPNLRSVVLHVWAERGTLAAFEACTLMSEFTSLAVAQNAINVLGYDASIPAFATSAEITLPTVAQGPIPAALDFVQLFPDGSLACSTPVTNVNRPFTKIPLATYARYAVLIDPAGGVGHAGIPVNWKIHA
jgi:hypothetical protein